MEGDSTNIFDHMVKVLTIGDGAVGKTNLILRFTENEFKMEYGMTIGVDFKTKILKIDDFRLKMNIWDTAGQERFKVIVESYYKGADGIFLLYAIDNRESFEHVKEWLSQIQAKTRATGTVIFLIGSKCDLEAERAVTKEEGKNLAEELGVQHFAETSSKEDIGVNEIFQEMGRQLKGVYDAPGNDFAMDRATSVLDNEGQKKKTKESKCC